MKTSAKVVIGWLLLNIMVVIFFDLALFIQTTPGMKHSGFLKKLGVSELLATIEWIFLIPANKIGNLFLTAPQITLSSFIFDFMGQIFSDKFWLGHGTSVDDYAAMIIICVGMIISTFKIFN